MPSSFAIVPRESPPRYTSSGSKRNIRKSVVFLLQLKLCSLVGKHLVWTVHNARSHEARFPRLEHWVVRSLASTVDDIIVHCDGIRPAIEAHLGAGSGDKNYGVEVARNASIFSSGSGAVEVNGGIWLKKGGHNTGTGIERDLQKAGAAMKLGWTVYGCTPAMIKSGDALQTIEILINSLT